MPKTNKQKLAEYGPIHERHLHSGIQFIVKYCGSRLIEDIRKGQLFSGAMVSAAIQSLLEFNRKAKRKSQPAVLSLSTAGIDLRCALPGRGEANESPPLASAGIDRIGFCTADKRNPRVFGFVARNRVNETVELHVCKCADATEAVQLAYTLNEAFTVAARERDASSASSAVVRGPHGNQSGSAEAAGLSLDQQPAAWCEFQARSLDQAALASAQQQQLHGDWVQFS